MFLKMEENGPLDESKAMFQHLLVPLDGSDIAEKALPPAVAIAASFGSRLTLLRVVLVPYVIGGYGNDLTEPPIVFLENRHREAEAYISETIRPLQSEDYQVFGLVLEGESVANVLLEAADTFAVDAIVMGTHGRSGFSRWLLGSVADKVVRYSTVPVLLIPTLTKPSLTDQIPFRVD